MAKISKRFDKGIVLRPTTTTTSVSGELSVNSSDNELKAYLNGAERSVVTKDQTQTLTNKTINADNNTISNLEVDNLKSGVLDTDLNAVSGADDTIPSAKAVKAYVDAQIDTIDQAAEISYSNATSGLAATNVQTAIDEVEASKDALVSLSGVALNATNLGTFTGTTIADNQTNKQALQALETSVETKAASSVVTEIDGNVNDLITLSGVAENTTSLGTFTGTTIPDSSTIKDALQSLETSVETKAASSVVTEIDGNVNDLITLSGVAENATSLGTFTGTTIADSSTVKTALQSLETSVETKATGAASSTDNAIVRFDSTTGKVVQNSLVTIDDAGIMSGATQLNVDNLRLDGNVLSSTSGNIDLTSAGIINLNQTTKFFSDVIADITVDSATGSNATITDPASKIIRLTNASLTSLDGIPAGLEGQHLTLINATGNSITINNNTGGTAANRILTGQKSNIILKDEASIHLEYDSTETRWMIIGGTGSTSASSGINYLSTNSDFEVNATGYSAYADAAGVVPVDATGGSPATTIARSTSSPLRGTASGLWSKSAANRQGEGFSYAFTIDTADQAKVLEISYDYTTSTNFVDADMRMFIYDVTNSILIEPSQRDILANSAQAKYLGYFQAASNSTSYRVVWHVASASALAYDFKLDNVKVGPPSIATNNRAVSARMRKASPNQTVSAITATTILYSATEHDTAGIADPTNNRFVIQESGYYYINAQASLSNLTSGEKYTIQLLQNSTVLSLNTKTVNDTSMHISNHCTMYLVKGDLITAQVQSTADASYTVNFTGLAASFFEIFLIKSDASSTANSIVAFNAWGTSTSLTTGAQTDITYTNKYDSAGGFNSTTTYTIPESGFYSYGFFCALNDFTGWALGERAYFVITSSDTSKSIADYFEMQTSDNAASQHISGGAYNAGYFTKGTTLKTSVYQENGGAIVPASANFYCFKVSNPSEVSPNEVVYAKYNTNAGQSITNSSGVFNIVDFEDKITDTHGAVTTGASWNFTAPITGYYQVNCSLEFASSAWTTGDGLRLVVSKDLGINISANMMTSWSSTFTGSLGMWGSTAVQMLKGETITIGILAVRTGGATTLRNQANRNEVTIFKI